MNSAKALDVWVVDDDASIRWVLERALKQAGLETRAFEHADAALAALRQGAPDVLVTDIRMPGRSGLEMLEEIRAKRPRLPVIVMTAHSDLESAVAAYKGGAFEYLPKPFDIDQAVDLVRRAAAQGQRSETTAVESRRIPEMLGHAPSMQEVFRAIGRLSRSSMTVLITGESGTGKELVARALHRHSPRAAKPFIALNTSAFTADLLESELFGHEKGAFTGAGELRRGRFEQADGGTLFLDEIGDMSPALQTRLLRVLAEGEFYRVGGQLPVKVDVRVIAATHQDLETRVREGLFREDLLHRLNVIRIEVPPLRQRREDIPQLLRHYLDVAAHRARRGPQGTGRGSRGGTGRIRLARQRAPAGQCLPPAHGAGRWARDRAQRHPVRPRRQQPDRWCRRQRLVAGARQLGAGPLRDRRCTVARRCPAGIRAHRDPRGAQGHPRRAPGSGQVAGLGPQHADAQAEGTRDGGRLIMGGHECRP